ncbi:hypothetical protein D9756_000163 [Leucocoprinus leucothites]|uniref:Uncharacterized protein n=1 Tax=Leucocoprinus leucothites TaxID=201217 RepID=A0A8H5GFF3_9AGAR|nr:hypothetical protein D9756_000163 [Leucoagaricus leucothites]
MPQSSSDSVSRGRIPVAKPLAAAGDGPTAQTASMGAEAKPQLSAAAILANPLTNTGIEPPSSLLAVDIATKVPRQADPPKAPLKQGAKALSEETDTPLHVLEANKNEFVQPPVDSKAPQDTPERREDESLAHSSTTDGPSVVPPTADPLQKELDDLERQVTQDETALADEKVRYDSERLIEFCDELGSNLFAKEAPAVMQSFMSFGEICERVEAEALQLAMTTPSLESEEPLQVYSAMMDKLDELQEQASKLESSILRLTKSASGTTSSTHSLEQESLPNASADKDHDDKEKEQLAEDAVTAREQIIGVFAACLPVLRARKANLSMAQELIDSAQENFSLALRMESLGIA